MNDKKLIKVQFYGFDKADGNPLDFILFNNPVIKEKYDLIIDKKNPDYVFYFTYFNLKDLVKHNNAVKIFVTGEPIASDLNFFDYYIGCENNPDNDRIHYFPQFLWFLDNLDVYKTNKSPIGYSENKKYFCDFIYRHEVEGKNSRKHYFDLLSSYKRVESCGTYLNNQIDKTVVGYHNSDNSKFAFQQKCKFSLCLQTLTDYPWFINEKILHSTFNGTVPIFLGPKETKLIFNPNRYIDIRDYKNDEELLNKIKELDQDDSKYLKMLNEPIFNDPNFVNNSRNEIIKLIDNIFSKKEIKRNSVDGATNYLNQLENLTRPTPRFFATVSRKLRKK